MGIDTADPRAGTAGIRVVVAARTSRLRTRVVESLKTASAQVFSVVAQASDGSAAITLCEQLRPAVLVLDPEIGGMSGAAVTRHLMNRCPTPILLITAGTGGDLAAVKACLSAGAVDVFSRPIPAGDDALPEWHRGLRAAVTVVSRIRVVTQHGRAGSRVVVVPPAPRAQSRTSADTPGNRPESVVAIGASTGGPAAIIAVLGGFPKPPAVPVLLVLHVNQTFHPSLTRWLRGATGHRVRSAEHGEPLAGATGYVVTAPPGKHLAVRGGMLVLTDERPRHSCRPSIDVLFESLAKECGKQAVACLLTGMGRDGAAGLLAIRQAGGATIAQDEATSVVYGMPAEAARLGAAQHILPIDQIGAMLNGLANDQRIAGAPS